ncbi:PspC domain-containing protein [Natronoflexus pectinivorans]|uniref:Phage shock protein C (PspC) family protein n=1 Tax=Natronoflexus pectinivorans TaxID=682526 RepID=A0A4R2GIA3_9BACT|nr:PspC domain-containing protein [Natronoflexus pectinivorans]TCO08299.1 phage shock protein C (PspC) family protein [Natronoflexus pectinivorans]
MKKTIHINLAGMAFHIEEDAYAKLEQYLKDVDRALGSDPGKKETLDDIEGRIAELLHPLAGENDRAVNSENVDDVIKVLGSPDDYKLTGEPFEGEEPSARSAAFAPKPVKKRLFRDVHNRILGGVCSGLGAYFNIDPIFFRLFFVLAIFLGPFFWISFLPYLILWIVMPKAYSIEQRMQMYGGEPLMAKSRQPYKSSGANTFFRILGVAFGFLLMLISFVVLTTIAMVIFPFVGLAEYIPGGEWIAGLPFIFFPEIPWFFSSALFMFLAIPFIMIFYLGLHLVFRFKRGGKYIGATGLILWFVSIGVLSIGGGWIAKNFSTHELIQEEFLLDDFNGDTLYVKHTNKGAGKDAVYFKDFYVNKDSDQIRVSARANIYLRKNAPDFLISIERHARGRNKYDAFENASNIDYFWNQNDSVLEISRFFELKENSSFRKQRVNVTIEIPEGMEIDGDRRLNVLR